MGIPVNPSQLLRDQRLHAAKASGGTSSDVITNRIVQIAEQCHLRGQVLDYGAGIGNLTRRLWELSRFDQITGADILPRPEDLPGAISWHCLDLNQGEGLPTDSFD